MSVGATKKKGIANFDNLVRPDAGVHDLDGDEIIRASFIDGRLKNCEKYAGPFLWVSTHFCVNAHSEFSSDVQAADVCGGCHCGNRGYYSSSCSVNVAEYEHAER